MATKQTNDPVIAHHPSTVAEIRRARAAITQHTRGLQEEGAASWKARQAGAPPSRPQTDHERRVTAHIQKYMNGSTPAHLLAPAVSRDEQIRAEIEANAFIDRELGRQEEDAREREAQQWVDDNAAAWRSLCHDIVVTAARLAALEDRAREMLEPIQSSWVTGLAMGSTIGSGLSLLGIGDPLQEMRTQALKEGVVTNAEIKKAENVAS